MKETGTISVSSQQETAAIRELLVDGNNLLLVVSGEDTGVYENSSAQGSPIHSYRSQMRIKLFLPTKSRQ